MFEAMAGIYDIATFGNHEFDWGRSNLFANVTAAKAVTGSKISFLNANIVYKKVAKRDSKGKIVKKRGRTVYLKNVNMFTPRMIVEKDGVKFGFFGIASNDFLKKTDPAVWSNATVLNPLTVAQAQANALRKEGADVIIAITHLGTEADGGYTSIQLRDYLTNVNLIIDGHSHTACPDKVNSCSYAGPNKAIIASNPGTLSSGVGKISITLGPNGYVVTPSKVAVTTVTQDAAILAAYNALVSANADYMNTKVGTTAVDLTAPRTSISNWTNGSLPALPAGPIDQSVRGGETLMGNFVADAYRVMTKAQIGWINGGGVRSSIKAGRNDDGEVIPGDITNRDLMTVQPYGNNVITIKITGATLKAALENAVANYPSESGGFLQVSGMKFTFDPTKAAGSRVTSITVGTKAYSAKTYYTVALPDFTKAGGDGFTMLKSAKTLATFGTDLVVVTAYLKKIGAVNVAIEGRITKFVPTP